MMNHLWQSTLFAIAAGLLTLAFRGNRANVRYALWFAASCKFLIPLALLMSLGARFPVAPVAHPKAVPVSVAIEQVTEPFGEPISPVPVPRTDGWRTSLWISWACGVAGFGFLRLRGWLRIRAAVRASVAVDLPAGVEVRSTPALLEPGVVGLWRPVLLLPEGIGEYLTREQLDAVLVHELCHVRRRDNLTSAIHMAVEVLFWFHPLVWWIGARMVEERERACDEAVVSLGSEPQVYAEAILNVCKLYVESPLACVSGVTGSDLKKRIEAIVANRAALQLNFAKKTALALAGFTAVAAPVAIGVMNLPRVRAQAAIPKFEVASVRACNGGESGGTAKGGRGGGGGGPQGPSPDRLTMVCQPLRNFIRTAYVNFAGGRRAMPGRQQWPIEGGPSWIDSERYQINALAEGTPGQEVMRGPMLQALLEERFQLKIRTEIREVPAYALTVAKGGPKLHPFVEGSCFVLDFSKPPAGREPSIPVCTFRMVKDAKPNAPVEWEVHGGTLDDLAEALSNDLDRIVINKTGISGKYDYQMEFGADETTAGLNMLRGPDGPVVSPDPTGGLSIFTAIQQQLGLKLESAKGPKQFLVVEKAERPTDN
jgi:uncharacterized protein (TIGR03435 family)